MCGNSPQPAAMFNDISFEERVLPDHPCFDMSQSHTGKPSIATEKLLSALLLQVPYAVCGEHLLMEQLAYNLLFRWIVGLNMNDPVWDPSIFNKNRERSLAGDVTQAFFDWVLGQAWELQWLYGEHFAVDGTRIEAQVGKKSCKRKHADLPPQPTQDPGTSNIHRRGVQHTNGAHASTTHPKARLQKKTQAQKVKPSYLCHVPMENFRDLVAITRLAQTMGTAPRDAVLAMVEAISGGLRVMQADDRNRDIHMFI